jgi:hypothetical protein
MMHAITLETVVQREEGMTYPRVITKKGNVASDEDDGDEESEENDDDGERSQMN